MITLLGNICRKALLILFFLSFHNTLNAAVKNTLSSGNWNSPAIWSPSGIPQPGDQVIIKSNHIVTLNTNANIISITIQSNGELNITAGKTLLLNGDLTVNGKMNLNGGDIYQNLSALFILGANSVFIWNPGNNSPAGATLFTNGIENFDPSSLLIIKKWYDYSNVPLGSVVTGNFGNLTLNTLSGTLLYEWNQNNQFETHKILGTLTIEQGWIVLDKSGSISNTTIGNINLATTNAYLDFHTGTYSSAFIINTTNVTNLGGELNGIYNGNGNITLNVTGNLSNQGNIVLIYNTGVQNVGNGNAVINVGGDYNQSAGDFRAIFNLATFNAGAANLSFNNIILTGGIMMGQYACHTNGGLSTFNVNGNLNINFTKATDKFRINGLTSLSGTFNNSKSNFIVGGNLSIAGNAAGEFTSSGSIGAETVTVTGNTIISGGNNNFNMGSHQITINTAGDLTITGGVTSFSKSPGIATISLGGNFNQSSGNFSVKGNTGQAEMIINGNFLLTGGTAFLHNNTSISSTNAVNLTVKGKFTHNGGIINYDDNVASAAINTIFMKGDEYIIGGNGSLTCAAAGSSNVFGILSFSRQGIINYKRTSNTHSIQQVKQLIQNGCTVEVVNGNLQIASHIVASTDYLKISSGGILKMGLAKIISNSLSAHSGIKVENSGKLSLQNTYGLYNGTDNACINATGNMDYYLAPGSIVEYYGNDSQTLTGTGNGLAATNDHKYGILEINFNGTPNTEYVYLDNSEVTVRTALKLIKGELKLNNNSITVVSGNASAITRTDGYIRSETFAAENRSFIKWMNMDNSVHVFPFGVKSTEYIPFTFTPVTGMGGTVAIATRATGPDNLPLPQGGSLPAVTHLRRNGIEIAVSSVIDRWFDISAPGFKANVTISYRGSENTIADSLADSPLAFQAWDGSNWTNSFGSGFNIKQGIGSVQVNNAIVFNHWIISTPLEYTISNGIFSFDALVKDKIVELNWSVINSIAISKFIVERSANDITYEETGEVNVGAINSEDGKYSSQDLSPVKGVSYYRIKQVNTDGKIFYSNVETINFIESPIGNFEIVSILPNPFKDHLTISFFSPKAGITGMQITNQSGQILRIEKILTKEGLNAFEYFEKQNLPQGIYVLTLKNNNTILSKKLFKA